jgi:hypothetical protein
MMIYNACGIYQFLTQESIFKFWNQTDNNMWTLHLDIFKNICPIIFGGLSEHPNV